MRLITPMKIMLLIALTLLFSSCVTVTEGGFSEKESPEKTVENLTQLGLGYIQKGRFDWARDRLHKALAINPDYAPANHAIGMIWQKEGELDLAEESYLKAIREDSGFTTAQHNLGRLYLQQKRFDQAGMYLTKAAGDRYYNNRVGAYGDLARNYYQQGNMQAAIDAYQDALRLSPYNLEAIVNISTLLFEQQNYQESLRYFDRLDRLVKRNQAKHTSHSLWLGIKLATIYGDTPRVLALAAELKQSFPDSNEYRLYQDSLRDVQS